MTNTALTKKECTALMVVGSKSNNCSESHDIIANYDFDRNLDRIVEFLGQVHPFLVSEKYSKYCCEIRPIKRGNDASFLKSINLWKLDGKGRKVLRDFLSKSDGKPFCIYYSVYSLDYKTLGNTKNGKPGRRGFINAENSRNSTSLVMDFDNIDEDEHTAYMKILHSVGIKPITVFSGHGYQNIVLLKETTYDKEMLKKFTRLLFQKGFPVDEKIIDPSRVMRMPYTTNCKCLDTKQKKYNGDGEMPVLTSITRYSSERYLVEEVFERINSIDSDEVKAVKSKVEEEKVKLRQPSNVLDDSGKAPSTNTRNEIEPVRRDVITPEKVEALSELLCFGELPEPIQKMLCYSPEGVRNHTMLFLLPFLKNKLGLSIEQIEQVMSIWGMNCSPEMCETYVESEIDRILAYGFKGEYGKYTSELCEIFGYIEFSMFTPKSKIAIPKKFFANLSNITDTGVAIYLAMLLNADGNPKWTVKSLSYLLQKDVGTIRRNLKGLTKAKLTDKRRGFKKNNEPYAYYINKFYNIMDGFLLIERNKLHDIRKNCTSAEVKLYLYLRYFAGQHNEVWASQNYIAEHIGYSQSRISEMITRLQKKSFVLKNVNKESRVKKCSYTLLG